MSNSTTPQPLSKEEWVEVFKTPVFRELWGIDNETTVDDVQRTVYGVKFDFVSGSPGYVGDLFVLHGDGMSAPPLVLIRQGDELIEAYPVAR